MRRSSCTHRGACCLNMSCMSTTSWSCVSRIALVQNSRTCDSFSSHFDSINFGPTPSRCHSHTFNVRFMLISMFRGSDACGLDGFDRSQAPPAGKSALHSLHHVARTTCSFECLLIPTNVSSTFSFVCQYSTNPSTKKALQCFAHKSCPIAIPAQLRREMCR